MKFKLWIAFWVIFTFLLGVAGGVFTFNTIMIRHAQCEGKFKADYAHCK